MERLSVVNSSKTTMGATVHELDACRFESPNDPARDLHQFDRLSEWVQRSDLYGPRPFAEHRPAWTRRFPEVTRWLLARSATEIQRLEAASTFLDADAPQGLPVSDAPEPLESWWSTSRALSRGPSLHARRKPSCPSLTRVAERKLVQVREVVGLALETGGPGCVVDWCGGRGALARVLARAGFDVKVVDRNSALLRRTEREAAAEGSRVVTEQLDALAPESTRSLRGAQLAAGLHACGLLTTRLLEGAAAEGVERVLVVPCCPHRLATGREYRGRSRAAQKLGVGLDAGALRLATAAVNVAPQRIARRRERELVLRQALDLALRDATGVDEYTPIGVLPRSARRSSVREFIEGEFTLRELSLPRGFDADHYERAGHERVREARALGVVRALFRRPIELWTILDHALAERDAGRTVAWGVFCRGDVTPRNVLIESRLNAARQAGVDRF